MNASIDKFRDWFISAPCKVSWVQFSTLQGILSKLTFICIADLNLPKVLRTDVWSQIEFGVAQARYKLSA